MVRVIVVAIFLILPKFASAASCGVIDTTYVIYTSEELKVDKGVSINGSSVTQDDFGADSGLNTDGSVETGSVNIPVLDPPSFPNNSSSVKLDEDDSPIDGSSEIFLEEVDIKKKTSLTFSGEGSFHIDELKVGDKAIVNFSAGTYFINKIDAGKDVILNFSTQVRLHIGEEFKIEKDTVINSGGDPSNVLIFLHEDAKFESKKDAAISAVIVGVNNDKIKFEKGVSFTGAILTDGKVELKKDVELNLSPAQQISIGSESTCEDEVTVSSVDHFVVSHDNNGINCVSEAINITAVDALGDPVIDYVSEITLSTQSGFGSFSLVSGSGVLDDGAANDGVAAYLFDLSDDGSITVSLSYPEGPSSLDIDVFQSDNSGLRDDDSEAALVFSPSGFTVTRSALSNPPPSLINDPIENQIAGSNFAVHITAYGQSPIDPVCGVIEAYDGNQNLAFWMDYANPSSGSIVATVNGSAISSNEAGATPQTVNFSSGRASVSTKYKDVGQIQIEMKDNSIRGATTPFILSPADFQITAVTDVSGSLNPAASSVSGPAFVNAGALFRVTVEVHDAEGDRTPNFGNESDVEGITVVSQNLVVPLGGVNGSGDDGALSNADAFVAIAPAGTWRNTSLSWDETGVIQLQASMADGSYLGTGDVLGTTSGNVGRFTPASFTLASSSVFGACGNSTYMGQAALGVGYQLEARGEGGNPLRNYDETLLGAGNVATLNMVAENNNYGSNLASRIFLPSSNWLAGIRSLNTSVGTFSRGASPDGPYSSLQLGVQVSDPIDGLSIGSPDMNAATIGDCSASATCNARAIVGSTEVIYGRLEVLNAFGPETETLNVGLLLSSYAASGAFVANSADSCSTYIQSAVSLGNYQDGLSSVSLLAPGSATNFVNGESIVNGGLLLSSPGAMNTGSVDVTYDAPSWLEYDWAGSGAVDPVGTAIFGQYRGHDKVIYWREVY